MQGKSVIVAVLAVAMVASAVVTPQVEEAFREWAQRHKRGYSEGSFEYNFRRRIFADNLHLMVKYQLENPSATFAMTKFADLTPTEFRNLYLSPKSFSLPENMTMTPFIEGPIATSVDWRQQGAVTNVKDQGMCGSCWSFSATGAMEGAWKIAKGELVSLSEQNLVDCDHECSTWQHEKACDEGCNGGLMWNAFQYVIKNKGIDTEACYPYSGTDQQCRFKSSCVGATLSSWQQVSTDENQIKAVLQQYGPLPIAVNANPFQFYSGGILDPHSCNPKDLDHGVLIVGYNDEGAKPYWIIKNSWGSSWGEKGYIRLVAGKGACGLNTAVTRPVV